MSTFRIAEIFGYSVADHTVTARRDRQRQHCPFRNAKCTKNSSTDPLGICTLERDDRLATVCPIRFQQNQQIFRDVGRLAFGPQQQILVTPELSILRVEHRLPDGTKRSKRVGKIDFLISRLDDAGEPVDFAALEVQAVYFSGHSLKPAFKEFVRSGQLPPESARRPDWRSSAQKRLMPQLALKVPVFRRWGKRFFIAVDSHFFNSLPTMKRETTIENSEISWLVYPFNKQGETFTIGDPDVHFTVWDEVQSALREGQAPEPADVLADIKRKRNKAGLVLRV